MTTTIDRTILRDAMCDLGLSTYQVAAASGVVQPVVRAIMAGEVRPTTHQLERLCDVLDLEITNYELGITNSEKRA